MKKFLLLIFLVLGTFCTYGQDVGDFDDITDDQNDIVDYDVKFILNQDASVVVVEKYSMDREFGKLLPIFKRNIETEQKLENIALYFNNRMIISLVDTDEDTVTVTAQELLRSRGGKNTIMLTYKIPASIYSLLNEDHFKWDFDLKNLPYNPNRGTVTFKTNGNPVLKKGQVIFKHPKGQITYDLKENMQVPITPAFAIAEVQASLNLAFEQGFFESTSTTTHLLKKGANSSIKGMAYIAPFCVMLAMVIYSFILWNKYGKDPKGPFVTEYDPPKDITPAFAKFLLNRKKHLDFSYFIITLIHLSLNKYIEITTYKGDICIKSLRGSNYSGLVEEDKIIYESLFAYSPQIILNKENKGYVGNAIQLLFHRILTKGEKYFTPNYWYAAVPATLLMTSFMLLLAFNKGIMLLCAAFCLVVCLSTFVLFIMIIDNVSPLYKDTYCKLMGFKQYMDIAEQGRVHFSDPLDEKRLFCDNLAYAYAFGMEKRIIRKIQYKFDSAAIEEYLNTYVDVDFLSQDYFIDTLHLLFNKSSSRIRKSDDLFRNIRF